MMQNSHLKNDLRIKRTEKLIFDALIRCTTQKGFAAVTVSNITQEAGINRATFYRHYKDKFDLLNKYTQRVFALLNTDKISSMRENEDGNRHHIPDKLIGIFDHVKENVAFYRVMWGKHGDPEFAEKIRKFIQKRIWMSLPQNLSLEERQIDLFVAYSSSASFGAVLWWLEHDMPYSSEEMIRILQKIESQNLGAILK